MPVFRYLERSPSKKLNRIFLIIGMILFLPVYFFNYRLVINTVGLDTFSRLLTSFDTEYFRGVLNIIGQRNQLGIFFLINIFNCISTIGFAVLFFSITLSIARSLRKDSKVYKISFVNPIVIVTIAFFDILSSLLFLLVIRSPENISEFTTFFIDSSYIIRMMLLYVEFIWIMVMGIFFLIRYVRNRNVKGTETK